MSRWRLLLSPVSLPAADFIIARVSWTSCRKDRKALGLLAPASPSSSKKTVLRIPETWTETRKAEPTEDNWLWELKGLEAMVSRTFLRTPGLRTKGLGIVMARWPAFKAWRGSLDWGFRAIRLLSLKSSAICLLLSGSTAMIIKPIHQHLAIRAESTKEATRCLLLSPFWIEQ